MRDAAIERFELEALGVVIQHAAVGQQRNRPGVDGENGALVMFSCLRLCDLAKQVGCRRAVLSLSADPRFVASRQKDRSGDTDDIWSVKI
jgi:hypothetical protein